MIFGCLRFLVPPSQRDIMHCSACFKCRKCRRELFTHQHLTTARSTEIPPKSINHDGLTGDCSSTQWFLSTSRLPEWVQNTVTQGGWTKGKLNCPSCQARVGSYDFTTDIYCHCQLHSLPHIRVVMSKVDLSPVQTEMTPGIRQYVPHQPAASGSCSDSVLYDLVRPCSAETGSHDQTESCESHDLIELGRAAAHGDQGGCGMSSSEYLSTCNSVHDIAECPESPPEGTTDNKTSGSSFDSCDKCNSDMSIISPGSHVSNLNCNQQIDQPVIDIDPGSVQNSQRNTRRHKSRAIITDDENQEDVPSPDTGSQVCTCHQETLTRQRRRNNIATYLDSNEVCSCRSTRNKGSTSDGGTVQSSNRYDALKVESCPDVQVTKVDWSMMQLADQEGLTCPVCLDVFYNPHVCHPCTHHFCAPCLWHLQRNQPQNTRCPLCRTVIKRCKPDHDLGDSIQEKYPAEYRRMYLEKKNLRGKLPGTRKRPGRKSSPASEYLSQYAAVVFVVLLLITLLSFICVAASMVLLSMFESIMDLVFAVENCVDGIWAGFLLLLLGADLKEASSVMNVTASESFGLMTHALRRLRRAASETLRYQNVVSFPGSYGNYFLIFALLLYALFRLVRRYTPGQQEV